MIIRKNSLELKDLVPHEKVVFSRVKRLAKSIRESGIIFKPIIVDSKTKLIIDGHHRVKALEMLGARYAPVIEVDYRNEIGRIELFTYVLIGDKDLTSRLAKLLASEVDGSGSLLVNLSIYGKQLKESFNVKVEPIYNIELIIELTKRYNLMYLKLPPINTHTHVLSPFRRSGVNSLLIIKPKPITHHMVFKMLREYSILPPRTTYHVTSLKHIYAPVKLKHLF